MGEKAGQQASQRWRWLWLLPALGLILGLARLQFDAEVMNLLPERSPVVAGLKLYQAKFANARELIVTVESADPLETEAAAQALAEAWQDQSNLVSRVVWQPPWMGAPESAAELTAYLWLNQSPAFFSNLVLKLQGSALTNALLTSRQRMASSFSPTEMARLGYDPLNLLSLPDSESADKVGRGEEPFVSADATFRVMYVQAAPALPGYKECVVWLRKVQETAELLIQNGDLAESVQLGYTGRPAFLAEIASGMERDMTTSVACTFLIISILFYVVHRRWRPLIGLTLLLAMILAGTAALGGLIFGTLNVISLGFAAILLGLSADYGLVLYHEASLHPAGSSQVIRRTIGPGILWSALTTAAAFCLLTFSSLPGLAQLGILVAGGLLLAAACMMGVYLPMLELSSDQNAPPPISAERRCREQGRSSLRWEPWAAWIVTTALVSLALLTFWHAPPTMDRSADALRPKESPAYATVERIKAKLKSPDDPMWLLIRGRTVGEIQSKLNRTQAALKAEADSETIAGFTLPIELWPDPVHQQANRSTAYNLEAKLPLMEKSFLAHGFTTHAFTMSQRLIRYWSRAAESEEITWPVHPASQWLFDQFTARGEGDYVVLGLIDTPAGRRADPTEAERLQSRLSGFDALLTGWGLLGPTLLSLVESELRRILPPMGLVVLICLSLAFRKAVTVLLSVLTLLVSGCGLALVMHWAGWHWNLLNLMALPLLLGAGVDYSIHIQLALRRHHGNRALVRRTIGRALLLCAATTATGFGSLGFSSNAGLSSLGKVCATGLILTFLTAVYLLPAWDGLWRGKRKGEG